MAWALVATIAVSGLSAPPAEAGTIQDFLCRYFHLFCPPNPGGGKGGNSVPEPASIAVLAAGACAAGLVARRRMKKNDRK